LLRKKQKELILPDFRDLLVSHGAIKAVCMTEVTTLPLIFFHIEIVFTPKNGTKAQHLNVVKSRRLVLRQATSEYYQGVE